MLKYEQEKLKEAMDEAGITTLPKGISPDIPIWIKGVAKIQLCDGSIAYGIVKREKNMDLSVVSIKGNTSSVRLIEEVYPIVTINKQKIKKFPESEKDNLNIRINYLKSLDLPYPIDYENASLKDLNKEVVRAALYFQLQTTN